MKQFTCSMNKKKEAVSRGSRDLLDDSELTQEIQSLYENELEKLIDGADEKEKPYYQSMDYILEEVIPATVESIQNDMYKYVSGGAYNIPGNFKQINWDWDRDHKDGIKFNDLRKKLLNGVNDADTEEFSHWGIDWFFKAFGTFGLKYNFREAVTDIVYNDMAEDGVLDESKKPESRKNGKKESMERCDSCGAVMTEYDYDRYGGLCKRCRDKGDAKKPTESSKKSEAVDDSKTIKMNVDYNTFMRLCFMAAYLTSDENYWDALWEYYSDFGEITEDADVFFDNLFQYTAWKDVEETYDELKDEYKDESKSKEECIEKAIDEGALDGVYPYGDHYLWIY